MHAATYAVVALVFAPLKKCTDGQKLSQHHVRADGHDGDRLAGCLAMVALYGRSHHGLRFCFHLNLVPGAFGPAECTDCRWHRLCRPRCGHCQQWPARQPDGADGLARRFGLAGLQSACSLYDPAGVAYF